MIHWNCLLRLLLLLVATTLAVASWLPASSPQPNILLIVADDLGWGDVGWHGGFGRTPEMDRLIRDGVELDQHYVYPVCSPTRAGLLTGRYSGRGSGTMRTRAKILRSFTAPPPMAGVSWL